jgi:hypothetical protein
MKSIEQKRAIFTLFLYFFTSFLRSDEFFLNFRENSQGVGVISVSGISGVVGFTVVAGLIAHCLRACCC